jgi:hypothetical protein
MVPFSFVHGASDLSLVLVLFWKVLLVLSRLGGCQSSLQLSSVGMITGVGVSSFLPEFAGWV